MNTSNKEYSRKTVGIICGLIFLSYIGCYNYLISDYDKKQTYTKRPDIQIPKYTGNIESGQREHEPKKIKRLRIIPTTETYEVSEWVTSGDWSHDNYPLTVTIPSQTIIMDIDYVEDHWDDYLSDPEDEIQYPPEIFQ